MESFVTKIKELPKEKAVSGSWKELFLMKFGVPAFFVSVGFLLENKPGTGLISALAELLFLPSILILKLLLRFVFSVITIF